MPALQLTPPRCAVCNKPVDRIEIRDDTNFGEPALVTVYCHGRTESVEVTFMDQIRADQIGFCDAFATRELSA